jgi:hypothetical protein
VQMPMLGLFALDDRDVRTRDWLHAQRPPGLRQACESQGWLLSWFRQLEPALLPVSLSDRFGLVDLGRVRVRGRLAWWSAGRNLLSVLWHLPYVQRCPVRSLCGFVHGEWIAVRRLCGDCDR